MLAEATDRAGITDENQETDTDCQPHRPEEPPE